MVLYFAYQVRRPACFPTPRRLKAELQTLAGGGCLAGGWLVTHFQCLADAFCGGFLGRRGERFAPGYLILGLQPVGVGNWGYGMAGRRASGD